MLFLFELLMKMCYKTSKSHFVFKGIENFINENRKFVSENNYKKFLLESFNVFNQYFLFYRLFFLFRFLEFLKEFF